MNKKQTSLSFHQILKMQLKMDKVSLTLHQLRENIEILRDCTTESISILESMIEMPEDKRTMKMLELLDILETKIKALDVIGEEIDEFARKDEEIKLGDDI